MTHHIAVDESPMEGIAIFIGNSITIPLVVLMAAAVAIPVALSMSLA